MRNLVVRSLVMGCLGVGLLAACGGSDTVGTGAGTGGSDTGGSGGSTSSGETTTSTGMGGETSNNTTGTGGASACAQLTDASDVVGVAKNVFEGTVVPSVGEALPDYIQIYLPVGTSGEVTLGPVANAADCGETAVCAVIIRDFDADAMSSGGYHLATSGTLTVESLSGYYMTGSLAGAKFVEVTIDATEGTIAEVADGVCAEYASLSIDVVPPAAGWECKAEYYGVMDGCDCDCGAVDPDCSDPAADVYGCIPGQTCNAMAQCEGLPTGWSCDPAKFDDGMNCDCECGALDADCDPDLSLPVAGCEMGFSCGGAICVPDAWTCAAAYYNETAQNASMLGCDCNCGAVDPDCAADPMAEVFGCMMGQTCNAMGMCQ
jgi:hypothetical protein